MSSEAMTERVKFNAMQASFSWHAEEHTPTPLKRGILKTIKISPQKGEIFYALSILPKRQFVTTVGVLQSK
jgi:hypothetical protein